MQFTLTPEQHAKVGAWLRDTVYPHLIAEQKKHMAEKPEAFGAIYEDSWANGVPYMGAIGGGLTYEFTPNSIGMSEFVSHWGYPDKLDLTDYASW